VSCAAAARLDARSLALFLLLLIPIVGGFRGKLSDPDLWWHLAAGEWIVEHGEVPWADPFSHTAAGRPWIAYSWLPEVLFYACVRSFGYASLIYLKSLAAAALLGWVYLASRAAGARWPASVLAASLAALGTAGVWAERPQLVSLLLLSVLLREILSLGVRRRLPWSAPLLMALWANVHVFFAVGWALLLLAAVCEALEGRPSRPLWSAAFLSLPAALATPYGWHLLAHLPTLARQPVVARAVAEFRSPDFSGVLGLLLGACLIGSIAVLVASRRRPTLFEAATFFGTMAGGLYMVRNMAIFAVVAAPTVAVRLDDWLPEPTEGRPSGLRRAVRAGLAAGGIALAGALAPVARDWRDNVASDLFPVAAADFVAERYPTARLFNDFDWGGFLIFRLYPAVRVSIDGRTQVYGDDLLAAYTRTHYLLPGWEASLRAASPDLVLWPAGGALAQVLRGSARWRVVYEDHVAVVFERVELARSRGLAACGNLTSAGLAGGRCSRRSTGGRALAAARESFRAARGGGSGGSARRPWRGPT
jgi:hypothetical protein